MRIKKLAIIFSAGWILTGIVTRGYAEHSAVTAGLGARILSRWGKRVFSNPDKKDRPLIFDAGGKLLYCPFYGPGGEKEPQGIEKIPYWSMVGGFLDYHIGKTFTLEGEVDYFWERELTLSPRDHRIRGVFAGELSFIPCLLTTKVNLFQTKRISAWLGGGGGLYLCKIGPARKYIRLNPVGYHILAGFRFLVSHSIYMGGEIKYCRCTIPEEGFITFDLDFDSFVGGLVLSYRFNENRKEE